MMNGIDMSKVKFVVAEPVTDDEEEFYDDQQPVEKVEPKAPSRRLKTVFKPDFEIGSLFTGGTIRLSNDSRFFASQAGLEVKFINTEDGTVISKIESDSRITTFSISPDNEEILIACANLQIKQYKIEDQSLVKIWKGHEGPVLDIDYHSLGNVAASSSSDKTVKVWDIEKGYCTHNFQHPGVVNIIKFHPTEYKIATVCDDLNIRIWDLVTKECIVLTNHLSQISGISFSNSGKELISSGRDKVLNVWDLVSKTPKKTIPIYQELGGIITLPKESYSTLPENVLEKVEKIRKRLLSQPATAEKVKRDDITIVLGAEEVLRAWCVETGECIWNDGNIEFKKKTDEDLDRELLFTITSIINSQDKIFTITSEHNILIYDCKTLEKQGEIIGYNDEVVDIKYVNEDSIVVATNSNEIKTYDLNTKRAKVLRGHDDLVMAIDVSADGKYLISGSRDKSAIFWDLEKREEILTLKGHTGIISCVALPRKQSTAMFAVTASDDRTIKLWKFSANQNNKKISASATKIAHDKDINSIAIAPNDKIIATASQDTFVKLWNADNLEPITTIKAHRRGVWHVEFSPVDQCMLTCSADGTIKIWSLTDYTCLKTLEGHKGSVLKASFISFGMQIVSVAAEGLIKLWNIKTNECVNTFEGHETKIWALSVKKDQENFITGGSDSKIIAWKDHTEIEEEIQKKKEENQVLYKQHLDTALRKKDYYGALKLALVLDQPNQTLNIFKSMYYDDETVGVSVVESCVSRLYDNEIIKCLRYIRDWNTNSKFITISHVVLNAIIVNFKPDHLSRLSLNEFPKLLESLIPYTDRHFQRIDRMLQKTYLIDFTIQSINPSTSTLLLESQEERSKNYRKDLDILLKEPKSEQPKPKQQSKDELSKSKKTVSQIKKQEKKKKFFKSQN
ncbi:hypothetical protein DICPUDRAFT_153024 [Dictyostelium purpureum]|uniref:U3 small nucleolar RNA-associated protein 13 C-terminal domain-containing protein n=1 Tax=Dictyostelium purpureum TaxID=5786 RepID=F0ZMV9_DICPU|nr:uncharacterized protein DICPUDRAFT_153024 [Dictyostelium purpureum]EGC34710.1 hypothetical protein DICPUDRAFT_153024 [Dictyostelium purpureum]|eukprot:XP_003288751.1 hypothetical protein DICPUDRAFT_153024 [Dictyostelium purpureum]